MATIIQLRKDKKRFYSKNNLKELANICNLLGTELLDIGEYHLALKEHQEEASIFDDLQDLIGVAIAHRRMGEVYCELRKWDEALKHQKTHLSLAKEVRNVVEQQRAYATIGRTYMHLAEEVAIDDDKDKHLSALQNSQNAFFKALATCDNISGEVDSNELAQMRARLYHNIGLVLDLKDDISGALKFISQALELCTSYSLTEDAYRAYAELSRIHLKLESTSKALEEAQLSLKLGTKMQNKRSIIGAHQLIAQIHLSNDDFLAARKSLYKAFKINHPAKEVREIVEKNLKLIVSLCIHREQITKPEADADSCLRSLDKIGDILCNFGLFKQANVFYQKRLELALENNKIMSFLAPIYTSLAQTYKDSKQFDKSLEYFQEELNIHSNSNPKEEVVTLIELAKVSEMMPHTSDETCDFYERALEIASKANLFQLKIIALRNYVASSRIPSDKRETLGAELEELYNVHGSDDIGYEESGDESEDDEVDLDLIEFSDSDEEERTKMPRVSRGSSGFRLKVNAMGETPLHQAVIRGNVSVVKRLLEQNHSVNVRDNSGWLPLHEACNWGFYQIAELLIEAGAWISDRGGKECSGTTPLHDAATNGHFDVIELLVEKGASVLVKNDSGSTPLDCIAKFTERSDLREDELEQCRRVQTILVERMQRAGYKVPERLKAPLNKKQKSVNFSEGRCPNEMSSGLQEHSDEEKEEEEESFDLVSVLDNEFDSPLSQSSLRPSTKNSATETYKTAIKSVGSHSRKFDMIHQASTSSKDFSRTPLIPEEDYVSEDWLIDDMESATRKRKRVDKFEFEHKEEARRKRSPDDLRFVPKKKLKQPKLTTLFKKSSLHPALLNDEDDAGFNVGADVEEVASIVADNAVRGSHPFSTQRRVRLSPETSQVCSSSHSPLRLHVKVLNKKMLVPVASSSQNNTIRWLEEEVSRRYFQFAGVKLLLKLSTLQNEVLNPDDTIDLTLSADSSELQATVTGIQDLPPLPERYAQTCHSSHLVPLSDVSSHLKDCDSSGELNLSQMYLRSEKDLQAIFSSLHHQNIQILNLSSCRMEDSGMLNLIQCMSSLSLLQKVEVEACSLTSGSLEALCGFLKGEELSLKKLSHLNLSYNDFSDSKFSHLKSLLSFPYLRTLKLNCCGLRLIVGPPSNTHVSSNVQFLDLSENELSLAVFSAVVSSCPNLTHLSVHGCIFKRGTSFLSGPTISTDSFSDPPLGTSLSALLGAGSECSLEHLDISSCSVTNHDLDILSSYFYRCASIISLNLSRNPGLSSISLAKLIQEIDKTSNVSLKELNLHGIETLAHDHTCIEYLAKTIEKRASSLHPFVSLSLPYSDVTKRLSELWLELYREKALIKIFSKTIFLTVECSS